MNPTRSRRALLGVALVSCAGASLACGPSFQVIYEGNARFEHCYALEEHPQTLVPEKADCWRDWSERYTYGQTRDRIHYAIARYVALSQATNVPTDEAMMMAAPGMTPRQSTITAPAPSNAFAPPPKVLEDYPANWPGRGPRVGVPPLMIDAGAVGADLDAGTGGGGASALPASGCGDGCGTRFRECSAVCAEDGGANAGDNGKASRAACAACAKTYKGCMRSCFK